MKHSDYITHINNKEDVIYLKSKLLHVNMRLFKSSQDYRQVIQTQASYLSMLVTTKMDGYKKPHGMSSANAGLAHNIIAICKNRNKKNEHSFVMINPEIVNLAGNEVETTTNCGSLTLKEPIKIFRHEMIQVEFFDYYGTKHREWFGPDDGSFTIQHEVDHNNGILITDYLNK